MRRFDNIRNKITIVWHLGVFGESIHGGQNRAEGRRCVWLGRCLKAVSQFYLAALKEKFGDLIV
jgi:hypothetical protein